jgi:hypothetical protein
MRNGLKALLICAAIAVVWSNTGMTAAPPDVRSFTSGRFALELDGAIVGFVKTVDGGLAFATVAKEPGDDFFFKKHLSNLGFRDIRLEVGADMNKSFYDWIAGSLAANYMRKSGAIVGADFNGNVVSRLEFHDALITEVGFPALDATSKDAAKLSLVLSPDRTVLNRKVSGKLSVNSAKTQKKWLTSSFRLSIDGIDATRVTKIDALTIKLPTPNDCFRCEELPVPEKIDFPHVVATIREPAQSVHDWFVDFAMQGNSGDSQEKGGTLEYLTPDLKTLFTLKFRNLGIFELMPVIEAGDALQHLVAAMYCESMEFVVP